MNSDYYYEHTFTRRGKQDVVVQPRDAEIIVRVAKNRFIDSQDIQRLTGASYRPLLRRLKLLRDVGALIEPRSTRLRRTTNGTKPMVYGLGNVGADYLSKVGVPRTNVDWTKLAREYTDFKMDHTLLQTKVMVDFEMSCRKYPRYEFFDEWALNRRLGLRRELPISTPFKWQTRLPHVAAPVGVVPDRTFAISDTQEPGFFYFFVEADRGKVVQKSTTQPLRRTVTRKHVAYHRSREVTKKLFGIGAYRVLWVALGAKRAENMRTMTRPHIGDGQGSPMFLYESHANIAGDDILTAEWTNARDERTRLVD